MAKQKAKPKRQTNSNLSEKAMLVHLRIGQFTGQRKDKQITDEVILVKKAEPDAGAWWTTCVSKLDLAQVNETGRRLRRIHHELTLPWMDGGLRILPSARFMEYTKKMRQYGGEYNEAIEALDWESIKRRAKKRLGKITNHQLPTASAVKAQMQYELQIFPIPTASDFRVQMNNDEVDTIKQDIAKSVESMTEKAMSSVWEKLTELIGKVEATMGQSGKKFKNSLIGNLRDFCELIPKLNLTDDNSLEELRKVAVSKLAHLRPDALREDNAARKKAHKSAKEIMEKIKGYTK